VDSDHVHDNEGTKEDDLEEIFDHAEEENDSDVDDEMVRKKLISV
jgi:hypothetical protein